MDTTDSNPAATLAAAAAAAYALRIAFANAGAPNYEAAHVAAWLESHRDIWLSLGTAPAASSK